MPGISSNESGPPDSNALPVGTWLGEFEIQAILGAGGFGIVYLALDHSLMRQVAIKEYVPSSLAARRLGATLTLNRGADADAYAAGLRSFLNEARLLASFDHPALVKVHRFWEANGTAYMVMPYYAGRTLKDVRRGMDCPPDEAWLQRFIQPLLGALEALHSQNIYHRDISPDNIMLLPDGRPVLLDFGSARRVVGEGEGAQAMTAVLKPNFAPVEQYGTTASLSQGPWTDLYAIGAVVYYMLCGEVPMPAVMRVLDDELPLMSEPGNASAKDVSHEFLAAMDWAMAIDPRDRPLSVKALRAAMKGETKPPLHGLSRAPITASWTSSIDQEPAHSAAHDDVPVVAAVASEPVIEAYASTQPAVRGSRFTRTHVVLAGALLTLCALGVGTWAWSDRSTPELAPVSMLAQPAVDVPKAIETVQPVQGIKPVQNTEMIEEIEQVEPAPAPTPTVVAEAPRAPAVVIPPAAAKPKVVKAAPVSVANAALPKAAPVAAVSTALTECAEKNLVMRAFCVRSACQQPQLRMNPRCVEMRAEDDARLQSQVTR